MILKSETSFLARVGDGEAMPHERFRRRERVSRRDLLSRQLVDTVLDTVTP